MAPPPQSQRVFSILMRKSERKVASYSLPCESDYAKVVTINKDHLNRGGEEAEFWGREEVAEEEEDEDL
eukprot:scaffold7160_cov156-Ochromonas_danica.AAC.2